MNVVRKMIKWLITPKKIRYVEEHEKIKHVQEKCTRDQHITYHVGMRQL